MEISLTLVLELPDKRVFLLINSYFQNVLEVCLRIKISLEFRKLKFVLSCESEK